MEYIILPETKIPVIMEADVVVVGGGPAGVGAAMRAAQNGADTVVIERFGRLGGYIRDPAEKFPQLSSNPLFHYESKKLTTFDPDMAAWVMNEMMEECGVKLLFRSLFVDTKVESDTIKAVIVENASGKQAIEGKVFVDATGRGDVVARSGAPYTSAGNEMGLPIPPGLMWKMSGVDYEKLFEYQEEDPKIDVRRIL